MLLTLRWAGVAPRGRQQLFPSSSSQEYERVSYQVYNVVHIPHFTHQASRIQLIQFSIHFYGVLNSLAFSLHFSERQVLYFFRNSWCTYKRSNASFGEYRPYVYYCRSVVTFQALLVGSLRRWVQRSISASTTAFCWWADLHQCPPIAKNWVFGWMSWWNLP